MYKLIIIKSKTEKRLNEYIATRFDIGVKLDKLRELPRKANGAHPLHGKLSGKWTCWLGSNIRLIYRIDEENKAIEIDAVGPHKIY